MHNALHSDLVRLDAVNISFWKEGAEENPSWWLRWALENRESWSFKLSPICEKVLKSRSLSILYSWYLLTLVWREKTGASARRREIFWPEFENWKVCFSGTWFPSQCNFNEASSLRILQAKKSQNEQRILIKKVQSRFSQVLLFSIETSILCRCTFLARDLESIDRWSSNPDCSDLRERKGRCDSHVIVRVRTETYLTVTRRWQLG